MTLHLTAKGDIEMNMRDKILTKAGELWNKTCCYNLELFLSKNGFNKGYSSHTWFYLPREIQAKWEMLHS